MLIDRDGMSNLYRGPSIDASYKVSVHLAKQFQRRRFLKIGQSETRIACGCGGHVCKWIRTKCAIFREDLLWQGELKKINLIYSNKVQSNLPKWSPPLSSHLY